MAFSVRQHNRFVAFPDPLESTSARVISFLHDADQVPPTATADTRALRGCCVFPGAYCVPVGHCIQVLSLLTAVAVAPLGSCRQAAVGTRASCNGHDAAVCANTARHRCVPAMAVGGHQVLRSSRGVAASALAAAACLRRPSHLLTGPLPVPPSACPALVRAGSPLNDER